MIGNVGYGILLYVYTILLCASDVSETFTKAIRVKVVEKFRDEANKEIEDSRFIVPFELSNVKSLEWFIIFAPKRFPSNFFYK